MRERSEWLTIIQDKHFAALYSEEQSVLLLKHFDDIGELQDAKAYTEWDRNRAIGTAVDEWRLAENAWRVEMGRQPRVGMEVDA